MTSISCRGSRRGLARESGAGKWVHLGEPMGFVIDEHLRELDEDDAGARVVGSRAASALRPRSRADYFRRFLDGLAQPLDGQSESPRSARGDPGSCDIERLGAQREVPGGPRGPSEPRSTRAWDAGSAQMMKKSLSNTRLMTRSSSAAIGTMDGMTGSPARLGSEAL